MGTIVQKVLEFLESYNTALNQVQGPSQCRCNATAQISSHEGSPGCGIFQLLLNPLLGHQFLPPICTSNVQTSKNWGLLFLFPCIKWIYIFHRSLWLKLKLFLHFVSFWVSSSLVKISVVLLYDGRIPVSHVNTLGWGKDFRYEIYSFHLKCLPLSLHELFWWNTNSVLRKHK